MYQNEKSNITKGLVSSFTVPFKVKYLKNNLLTMYTFYTNVTDK